MTSATPPPFPQPRQQLRQRSSPAPSLTPAQHPPPQDYSCDTPNGTGDENSEQATKVAGIFAGAGVENANEISHDKTTEGPSRHQESAFHDWRLLDDTSGREVVGGEVGRVWPPTRFCRCVQLRFSGVPVRNMPARLGERFRNSSTLFSNPRSNSETVTPNDFEIINSVKIVVFFNPRSMFPTKVRCRPSGLLFPRRLSAFFDRSKQLRQRDP